MGVLVDSHCHISLATQVDAEFLDSFYEKNNVLKICLMSTNHLDYKVIDQLALKSNKIIPSFGIHPWFAHIFTFEKKIQKLDHYKHVFNVNELDQEFLSKLPEPTDINIHFDKLQEVIKRHEKVVIGEIGLDKLFRIPFNGYFSHDKSKLTNYKTIMAHQVKIFELQLQFAFDNNIPLSIHNVKAMGNLIELVQRLYKDSTSNLMMHSYTGSVDSLKLLSRIVGQDHIFVSISWVFNGEDGRYKAILDTLERNQILIESDVSINNEQTQVELLKQVDSVVNSDKNISENLENLDKFLKSSP